MNYCSNCGGRLTYGTPPGDDRERFLCTACGLIHYQNPRVVVGCIPEHDGRILLCRRAIDPCYGKWTLPAGYLENGESVTAGAERETWEEAGARVEGLTPYRLFNICHISQIYFMFRAQLSSLDFRPGQESLEVRMFSQSEIPWEQIAFRVITESLRAYYNDRAAGSFAFAVADILPAAADLLSAINS